MSGIKGIDDLALRLAVQLAREQPRCDNTINELPSVAVAIATDLVPLYRNGVTYGCPISGFPSGGSSSSIYFNVKSYGATGNGSTDDTVAIQSAIAAAAAANGGTVFFPPGQYLVSSSLSITNSGISFLGCGPSASKIVSSSASAAPAPTVLAFSSGVSYAFVDSIGFIGNSIAPSGPPPNAPTVITFSGGVKVAVYNCYFANSLGTCISFTGCSDGEVAFCRFNGTGYNGAGPALGLQTPAVISDTTSVGIRVHHNDFENCQYFAIQHLGANCEASFNFIKGTGASGIRIGNGSSTRVVGTRIIGNYIGKSFKFSSGDGSGGGTGMYASNADNLVVSSNVVDSPAADGMAFAACNNSVISNNTIFNCCQGGFGDCGIQFNPQSGNPGGNVGMVFTGNVSYDNQGTPTQQNGMRILGPGSGGAFGSVIAGNSFYGFTGTVGGQPQHGIVMNDAILDDDSNVIRSNTDWLDFQHQGTLMTVNANITASSIGLPANSVLYTTTIEAGEMGLQRGFKMEFYGTTTVSSGSSDTFQLFLSYGALGNMFQDTARTIVNNAKWLLEAWIFGGASNQSQRVIARLTYNGSLVSVQESSLSADSTSPQVLALQVSTTNVNPPITVNCNAATVRRA